MGYSRIPRAARIAGWVVVLQVLFQIGLSLDSPWMYYDRAKWDPSKKVWIPQPSPSEYGLILEWLQGKHGPSPFTLTYWRGSHGSFGHAPSQGERTGRHQ